MEARPVMNTDILPTLCELASLLGAHGRSDWQCVVEEITAETLRAELAGRDLARTLFGGMGSLNDVVLVSPSGEVLEKENTVLSTLMAELYEKLHPSPP
jgi:hypothetical protein